MNVFKYLFLIVALAFSCLEETRAQEKVEYPDISYAGTPRQCIIGGITTEGVKAYDEYVLLGLSGLEVGQVVSVPGPELTEAVKRYWKHGLFSDVSITADSIVNSKIYLKIHLKQRPRISEINIYGVKKGEREDLESKIGIIKGGQITPNYINRAKIVVKRYFDDKGFKNAEVDIQQEPDLSADDRVILNINIDKKEKTKVRTITFDGLKAMSDKRIKGGWFRKGYFGKIHEAGKLRNFLKAKKFTEERYAEAKEKLEESYSELGYSDFYIEKDSVWNVDHNHVSIYVKVNEGRKYYIRNISWVGNTIVTTDFLDLLLRMKKGDVYNKVLLTKRLNTDEDAVGNYYYNNGYVFFQCEPTEVNIVGDSVDLEMRIIEGPKAYINRVRILGNDRLYENVVRRELRTKPGDLFSKDALERSVRELASMGHFDPENCVPKVTPNGEDGTVDLNYNLQSKSNDQIEFSMGWGYTGVIGRVSLKLNNFSIRNLFGKNKERRGIMPVGDGEQLALSAQTNGRYYQSYSISYTDPWFGKKRPNQFTVGAYFSRSTGISNSYYNEGYMTNYYNYLYGYGNYNGYNSYVNYYDPDQYIQLFGVSIGWGKRLRWPDDYFMLSAELSYQRYMLKNWQYFLVSTGNCNNINVGLTLSRVSTDNQLFPRRGSEFMASVTLTPPWSLWDGKDYKNLATNRNAYNYMDQMREKYKWIEYHKWKFRSRTYTALTGGQKCLVLMTRVELGILGSYNKYKKSPFETFYVGGDGMSGYSTSYAEETIGLRGYENGSLTPYGAEGYAYNRLTLELRYPLMLGNTTIYGLGFVEGGNAWTDVKKIDPFSLKRSAGVGVRLFLPMVGLMGIDWAYGFDKIFNSKNYGGSHFHFVLGQEF